MKHIALAVALMSTLMLCEHGSAQQNTKAGTPLLRLGTVRLTKSVMLTGGERLRPGLYDVRLTGEEPKPSTGTIPGVERQVEFVRRGYFFRRGKVNGKEIVHVVPAADIGKIEDHEVVPTRGNQTVKETPHDFLRFWFNKGELHYLVYLRQAS